jgi:hypothetical protein
MASAQLAALGVPAAITALLPPNCISWLESALNAGGNIHDVKVLVNFSAFCSRRNFARSWTSVFAACFGTHDANAHHGAFLSRSSRFYFSIAHSSLKIVPSTGTRLTPRAGR